MVSLIVENLAEGFPSRSYWNPIPNWSRMISGRRSAFAAEMTRGASYPNPGRGEYAMRIKPDENMDVRLVPLLAAEGHDVDTAKSEGLSGSDDDVIFQACLMTGRALMTLDLDFSNPFRFPPSRAKGLS